MWRAQYGKTYITSFKEIHWSHLTLSSSVPFALVVPEEPHMDDVAA